MIDPKTMIAGSERGGATAFSAGYVPFCLDDRRHPWYAHPILKRHDSSLAQLVHTQQVLDKIDGGLQEQRSHVAESSKDQGQLRDQVTKLSPGNGVAIEAICTEKGQAGENLFHTVQAQIERQNESMKSRVATLESSRDVDKAQITMLENRLGEVRDEVSEQTRQFSAVRRQMENQDQDDGTANRLASPLDSEQQDRQNVEAINNRLARTADLF
jgi:chromosome segregation ATPase